MAMSLFSRIGRMEAPSTPHQDSKKPLSFPAYYITAYFTYYSSGLMFPHLRSLSCRVGPQISYPTEV